MFLKGMDFPVGFSGFTGSLMYAWSRSTLRRRNWPLASFVLSRMMRTFSRDETSLIFSSSAKMRTFSAVRPLKGK